MLLVTNILIMDDKMLDAKTINKYYKDVSKEELKKFQHFLKTHTLKKIDSNGQGIEYYSSGRGEKTILLTPGGMGILPPEYGFRYILKLEKDFRVIAPAIPEVKSLDEYSDVLNRILENEEIEKIIIIGSSGGGIFSQPYFMRNFNRVEAMILTNTFGPKKERNNKLVFKLLRLFPAFFLKALFKKKGKKLASVDIPPEAKAKIGFSMALFNEILSKSFDKKLLLSQMELFFEFNEKDSYKFEDFKQWKGKVLIITCEDDPGFIDVDYLMKNLPNTELFTFPKGLKHMAPVIQPDKYWRIIYKFLGSL